jgi:hypothetical protein
MEMLLGEHVLMIRMEQQGGVDDRGVGQSQRSSSGSMMLYKGEAAAVVGVRICFMLVRGHRSCGIIVGRTGSKNRRVCIKSIGWGRGWDVHGRDKGITDGGGRSG